MTPDIPCAACMCHSGAFNPFTAPGVGVQNMTFLVRSHQLKYKILRIGLLESSLPGLSWKQASFWDSQFPPSKIESQWSSSFKMYPHGERGSLAFRLQCQAFYFLKEVWTAMKLQRAIRQSVSFPFGRLHAPRQSMRQKSETFYSSLAQVFWLTVRLRPLRDQNLTVWNRSTKRTKR